jgi:hypothetical protein
MTINSSKDSIACVSLRLGRQDDFWQSEIFLQDSFFLSTSQVKENPMAGA